jgi:SAM-dependent methyltransferase
MSEFDPAELYTPPPGAPHQTLEWLESYVVVQSMQFMIDCLPMIRKLLFGKQRRETVTVLDVGTGTGAGANLLATLYQSDFLGPRLKVDALELAPHLKGYAQAKFPLVNYIVGDVLTWGNPGPWDIVICSHTLEHTEDPEGFVFHLAGLAKLWALFYTPWKERELIPGHLARIDRHFLERVGSKLHEVIESPAWFRIHERARCVAFAVPGYSPLDAPPVFPSPETERG